MKNFLVQDWMSKNPVTIDAHETLPDAHKLMTERKIRRLLVTENGKLAGIVTLGDVRSAEPSSATSLSIYELNYLLAKLTIDKVMHRNPIAVSPKTTVQEAAKIMLEKKVAGLPVLEGKDLVGIITESDIFRMVAKTWEKE